MKYIVTDSLGNHRLPTLPSRTHYTVLDTDLDIAIAQFDTLAEASKFTSKHGPGADTLTVVRA